MERWRGRVALVTGASSGLGFSMAKFLAERGMKVVGCARNIAAIEKLGEELKGKAGSVTAVRCDVSKQEEVAAMFQMIRHDSTLGRVDVCINNAGLDHLQPVLTGDPTLWKHLFDVNVLGLMMVTKEAFQLMQENNIDDGHIILINSIYGKTVPIYKLCHCYTASKFAVSAIAVGLRQELREMNSKIRVSQVCPGTVKTEILSRATGDEKTSEACFSMMKHLQPDEICATIQFILETPPHIEIKDVVVCPQGEHLAD